MFALALIAAPVLLTLAAGSSLTIEGDSNLHKWKCQASKFDAAGESTSGTEVAASLVGFELDVPVQQIQCGNDTMNGKLRDALKAGRFAGIDYKFISIRKDAAAGKVEVTGQLSVAGVEKTQTTTLTLASAPGDLQTAQGALEMKMSDFGVAPPTALLGALKTADAITVRFDLKFLTQDKK